MRTFIIIMLLFTAYWSNGQCKTAENEVYEISTNKEGKQTVKECKWVTVCQDVVEFRVTNTTVRTFTKITENKWQDLSGKVVDSAKDGDDVYFAQGSKVWVYNKTKLK
jgi:hypothetical protein